MHPARDELIRFAGQELGDNERVGEIAAHVRICVFCAEFCENYRQLIEPLEPSSPEFLTERMNRLADALYDFAIRSRIIDLNPIISDSADRSVSYLAADGDSNKRKKVQNIATLYSENPDVVLRVMQAPDEVGNYLQLVAEDDRLAKHVMVQVPELGKEFITDADGRAEIDMETTKGLDQLKWQIKLPEAVFELEPFSYDPDNVEYAEEISLETDRSDLIKVRFEGKTEGKQLSIRVIELDGRSDFGPIKIAISQKHRSELIPVAPGESISFGLVDSDTTINIRLYQ
jgi:hypothetical protein